MWPWVAVAAANAFELPDMCQVIFRIPTPWGGLPIYGFGLMLFLAFIVTTWLAGRRARSYGIDPDLIQDLALWIFIPGIIGARIVYMIQYGQPLNQFFKIWEGGLVFYGSLVGGWVGYLLVWLFVLRKKRISTWLLADILAPSIALGLCLGRVGCLLNGCCYGNVACTHCPAIHFPLPSPPRQTLVAKGYQAAAGFTLAEGAADPLTVGTVDPASAAYQAGLRPGDVVTKVDDGDVKTYRDLWFALVAEWPRGKNDLTLSVRRRGEELTLPVFDPRTLGLHPTQIYESISTALLCLLLLALTPYRRHDGDVMILFLVGYSIHRFLNEMLRNDTDPPLRDFLQLPDMIREMTLSQLGSVLVLSVAVGLWWFWIRRLPVSQPVADKARPGA
jgi:prolipoprotein diacylglyceryltransferase